LAIAAFTVLKLPVMVSKAESHIPEPEMNTIGFSTSVTSSPNGSLEAAAGGAAAGGACAVAGERIAKLTAAASAADSHQSRERIIGFSPASPPGEASNRFAGCSRRYYTIRGPAGDLIVAPI
jgi:hypothetical protein